jgi:hypothetical protein
VRTLASNLAGQGCQRGNIYEGVADGAALASHSLLLERDEPALIILDTGSLAVQDTVALSVLPNPLAMGPSIYVSKFEGVFLAAPDSVIVLTQA